MFKRIALPFAPLALSCAVALSVQAAPQVQPDFAAPDAAREALLANARFLIAKGRADLARSVIDQVFAIKNEDPETLVLFGDLELRSGRVQSAEKTLERLEKVAPDSTYSRELVALIRLYTVDRGRLVQLRTLHETGRWPEAQVLAKSLFPSGIAPGSLGKEFANLMASGPLAQARSPAPEGARAFAKAYRAYPQARGGPARSDKVARPHRSGRSALAAAPAYPSSAADRAIEAGYAALKSSELSDAESNFRNALRLRPSSAAAMGGLGIVRARQERHAEALGFFEMAQKREKDSKSTVWRDLASNSAYWQDIARARAEVSSGAIPEARATLHRALMQAPQQTEAPLMMAQLDLQTRQFESAESTFKVLASKTPADDRVWRGLLSSVLQRPTATDTEVAAVWDQVIAANGREKFQRESYVSADLVDVAAVRAWVRKRSDAGDRAAADSSLESALKLAPADPWLRHDRARILLDRGLASQANRAMREGLDLSPANPDMNHAQAIIAFAQDNDAEAIKAIEAIPIASRTDPMKTLQSSARFELVMRRLEGRARFDANTSAQGLIDEASDLAGQDSARQLRVARIELAAGNEVAVDRRLAGMDTSRLSTQDQVAHALMRSDIGQHELAMKSLNALVAGWPASIPVDTLIAAQSTVTSRQIDKMLLNGQRDAAVEQVAVAFSAWNLGGRVPAGVLSAQANLWLQMHADDRALLASNQALASEPNHPGALLVRARVLAATGDTAAAKPELRRLDGLLPASDIAGRLAVAQAWSSIGENETAKQWLAPLLARQPGNADLRLESARIARAEGDYAGALTHLRYVTGLKPPAINVMQLTMGASGALSAAGSVNDARTLSTVREAIASIESRRQPRFEMGVSPFSQGGSDGTSGVRGQEWTAAVYWPVEYRGHVFGQVDRVRLDAGSLPAPFASAREFGQIASTGVGLAASLPQRADGYSVGIGWVDDTRRVDIGVVGMDLNQSNVTGGWRQDFKLAGNDAVLDVSRRVETRNLLTYSGAIDPVSGETWGAITNNSAGLRVDQQVADSDWRRSLTARVGAMAGRNVETNPFVQAQVSYMKPWQQTKDYTLQAGLAVNLWHYERNSSGFTFGQGGYFSPQLYAALQLPFDLTGSSGPWTYALRGNLTYSWFKEKEAPFYPTKAALQVASGNNVVPATINQGPGISLRALTEYRANPYWAVGGYAELDRGRDYRPSRAGVYLRYYFDGLFGAPSTPPRPVRVYAQF